jgi:hypothetical protein
MLWERLNGRRVSSRRREDEKVSLRRRIHDAVHSGMANGELEELVENEPRAIRYLLGMSYNSEPEIRETATRGVALASRYHPKLVQEAVRRLIWAMNDESGTNALSAPAVLQAIADESPELLLPMVPDLTRLAADPGLQDGIAKTLKTVANRCPGKVGEILGRSLNECRGSADEEIW